MEHRHKIGRHTETIFEQIARFGVIALMGIFIIIAITGNIGAQQHDGIYTYVAIVLTAGFLWVFMAFAEKTTSAYRVWLMVIFVMGLLLRILMITTWSIEPTSDFEDTYKVALALARTDVSDIHTLMVGDFHYYYTTWAVHIPFILIKMFIIRIFGEGYYPIQIIFNIFSAMSCVMTAMIAKSLYGRRAGIISGLMMCVFPLGLMYSAVLSNQHIATFFFLQSIYILLENPIKKRLPNIALSAISMTISQIVRPEMLVYIIAVICYFLYRDILSIRHKRKAKLAGRKFAGYSMMFLSIYCMIMIAVSLSLTENSFVKTGIIDTNYKYKIVTGLNAASNGTWTEEDAQYSDNDQVLNTLIAERSQDKWQVARLAFTKLGYQYGSYDYSWCTEGKTGSFIEHWYSPITNGVMFVILLLALLQVITAFYNKRRRELFLMIIMVGYFLVFTIIEVQNRYNYFSIPIFMIMASGALVYISENGRQFACVLIEKYNEKCLKINKI